jgi:hypothetical protein
VGLGFEMNLHEVVRAGRNGFVNPDHVVRVTLFAKHGTATQAVGGCVRVVLLCEPRAVFQIVKREDTDASRFLLRHISLKHRPISSNFSLP